MTFLNSTHIYGWFKTFPYDSQFFGEILWGQGPKLRGAWKILGGQCPKQGGATAPPAPPAAYPLVINKVFGK